MDLPIASLMCAGQKDLMICDLLLEVKNKLLSGTLLTLLRDSNNQVSSEDKWLLPTSIAALLMKRVGFILEVIMDRFKYGLTHAKLSKQ